MRCDEGYVGRRVRKMSIGRRKRSLQDCINDNSGVSASATPGSRWDAACSRRWMTCEFTLPAVFGLLSLTLRKLRDNFSTKYCCSCHTYKHHWTLQFYTNFNGFDFSWGKEGQGSLLISFSCVLCVACLSIALTVCLCLTVSQSVLQRGVMVSIRGAMISTSTFPACQPPRWPSS